MNDANIGHAEALNSDNLGARTHKAVSWQLLSQGLNTSLLLVTSIVLARLLTPKDFGLVAMATTMTGLIYIFQNLGLTQALVQRKQVNKSHLHSAFWGTLLMGLVLCGLTQLIAPYVGAFFHEPRMVPVLRVTVLSFIVSPLGTAPRATLQRALDFRRQSIASMAGTLTQSLLGIGLALCGYGYWSLVWAILASSVINMLVLCVLTGYYPPFMPTLRGLRDLWAFGLGATGAGLGGYLANQIDYVIVGHRLDATALGLYQRAFGWVAHPVTLLVYSISAVFLPVFSTIQDDPERIREAYGRLLSALVTVCYPVFGLMLVCVPELVPVLLGEQWRASIAPTQILVGVGMLMVFHAPMSTVVRSCGRVYGELWRQVLHAAVLAGAAWIGSHWGIIGVAWGVLLADLVHYLLLGHLVHTTITFGIGDYCRALRSSMLVTLAVVGLGAACRTLAYGRGLSDASTLAITIGVGTSVGIVLTLVSPFPEAKNAVAMLRRSVSSGL